MGICVVYIIDLKSLALGSSESLRFEVVDLLRPASIRCLALSDPHSVSPATHPSSARRAKASNWRGLLALGWENQVDVHDLVKNIHIETLEVLVSNPHQSGAGQILHFAGPGISDFFHSVKSPLCLSFIGVCPRCNLRRRNYRSDSLKSTPSNNFRALRASSLPSPIR